MQLGICNFAFPKIDALAVSDVLASCDVIDFAPTVHGFQWGQSCPYPDSLFLPRVQISCIQSIFFGLRDASLVKSDAAFTVLSGHLDTACRWANNLKAEGLVFGAPGMRLGSTEALAVIEARLLQLHYQVERCGQRLYLEAASPRFGTEFVASSASLLSLMERFPQMHLHLDIGQMLEEGLDPIHEFTVWMQRIGHFHLSSPDLAMPTPDTVAIWKDIIRLMKDSTISAVVEIQHIGLEQSTDLVALMADLRATQFE